MRSAALLSVLALAMLAPMVQAQSLVASVDLQCEERTEIEVAPWSTPVASYVCTVANESVYQEKIDITVYSDGLAVAHPGSITLNVGLRRPSRSPYKQTQGRKLRADKTPLRSRSWKSTAFLRQTSLLQTPRSSWIFFNTVRPR